MTLLATGSQISIRNAAGGVKFTSDDKLVYKRATFTGSGGLGSGVGATTLTAYLPGLTMTTNDFPIIQVFPTSTTGNMVPAQVLNSWVTLNFALPVHFTHSTTEIRIGNYETMTAAVGTDMTYWYVGFTMWDHARRMWWGRLPTSTIMFDWRVVILSYR